MPEQSQIALLDLVGKMDPGTQGPNRVDAPALWSYDQRFKPLLSIHRIASAIVAMNSLYHIGFTGTQEIPASYQIQMLAEKLEELADGRDKGTYFLHHGDCIGADSIAHSLASSAGYEIIVHPPINPVKRAFCKGYHLQMPPRGYLDRNRDIVDASECLLAVPKGYEEVRSGTWSTVRYAKKVGKPVHLLFGEQ